VGHPLHHEGGRHDAQPCPLQLLQLGVGSRAVGLGHAEVGPHGEGLVECDDGGAPHREDGDHLVPAGAHLVPQVPVHHCLQHILPLTKACKAQSRGRIVNKEVGTDSPHPPFYGLV